eukprot:3075066-Rhodomonas_salina.1
MCDPPHRRPDLDAVGGTRGVRGRERVGGGGTIEGGDRSAVPLEAKTVVHGCRLLGPRQATLVHRRPMSVPALRTRDTVETWYHTSRPRYAGTQDSPRTVCAEKPCDVSGLTNLEEDAP